MEAKKIFISITLIPETRTEQLVLELNNRISKNFEVNKIDTSTQDYAHVSLYNANFPAHNRELIESAIEKITQDFSEIKLTPTRINLKSRFISVVFKKTQELERLQNEIIKLLNPLREGMLQSKYTEKDEFYSERELLNAHEYGYPFCKDQFSPHMTIAELENEKDGDSATKEIDWNNIVTINKLSMRILFTDESGNRTKETRLFDLLPK